MAINSWSWTDKSHLVFDLFRKNYGILSISCERNISSGSWRAVPWTGRFREPIQLPTSSLKPVKLQNILIHSVAFQERSWQTIWFHGVNCCRVQLQWWIRLQWDCRSNKLYPRESVCCNIAFFATLMIFVENWLSSTFYLKVQTIDLWPVLIMNFDL